MKKSLTFCGPVLTIKNQHFNARPWENKNPMIYRCPWCWFTIPIDFYDFMSDKYPENMSFCFKSAGIINFALMEIGEGHLMYFNEDTKFDIPKWTCFLFLHGILLWIILIKNKQTRALKFLPDWNKKEAWQEDRVIVGSSRLLFVCISCGLGPPKRI